MTTQKNLVSLLLLGNRKIFCTIVQTKAEKQKGTMTTEKSIALGVNIFCYFQLLQLTKKLVSLLL